MDTSGIMYSEVLMPQMAARTDREARAVQLALAGWSYDDIARKLGYANRSGPFKAVRRALARDVVDGVREYRKLELARLDARQASYRERAVDGDAKAATVVLRTIEQRTRLLGSGPGREGRRARLPVIGGDLVG